VWSWQGCCRLYPRDEKGPGRPGAGGFVMSNEKVDVDLVKAVIEHHYFTSLLEVKVDEASLEFWKRRWKVGIVIFGILSAVLGFFGITKYFSLKDQYIQFKIMISDVEDKQKRIVKTESLIETHLNNINETLKQTEKLRTESSDLVASSSDLIGGALRATEVAGRLLALEKDLSTSKEELRVFASTLDDERKYIVDGWSEIEPNYKAMSAKIRSALTTIDEKVALISDLEDVVTCSLKLRPKYFTLRENNEPGEEFNGLTFCVGAIYDPSGALRRRKNLHVRDSRGNILALHKVDDETTPMLVQKPGDSAMFTDMHGTRYRISYMLFSTEKFLLMELQMQPSADCSGWDSKL
jgi:hypothetical protein